MISGYYCWCSLHSLQPWIPCSVAAVAAVRTCQKWPALMPQVLCCQLCWWLLSSWLFTSCCLYHDESWHSHHPDLLSQGSLSPYGDYRSSLALGCRALLKNLKHRFPEAGLVLCERHHSYRIMYEHSVSEPVTIQQLGVNTLNSTPFYPPSKKKNLNGSVPRITSGSKCFLWLPGVTNPSQARESK